MDSRKALESLQHLVSKAGQAQIAAAAEGLTTLNQLERQSGDTEKRVAANIRKLADQETKLLKMTEELSDTQRDLVALRASSAKETKELQDQAEAVQAEARERINQAQREASKTEAASREAMKTLKSLEDQIAERKATLARLIA
ncbi:MAG: hypothetical protein ACR2RF_09970 [Geminicoccaceae bacterium]